MAADRFFDKTHCDRCKDSLSIGGGSRSFIMSWFTEETICFACSQKESELKQRMRAAGMDPARYEGCGYVPIA